LAAPAPELVRAKVVFDPSTRSIVYVPEAVRERVVSFAAILRTFEAESRVRAAAPPDDNVTAPVPVNDGDVLDVENTPVAPVKAVVDAVPMVPEVVIESAPTSIAPKLAVIDPASRAPTPVIPV
jgi:hypothetical protein